MEERCANEEELGAGVSESEILVPKEHRGALFEYLLRLADDRLILGHRLSEWCGHGPILEEDLALGNIALDLIGQAQTFLALAGKVEAKGRNEDTLAYFRNEREFKNSKLCELPRGDFAVTVLRQYFFEQFAVLHTSALTKCSFSPLQALAARAVKEHTYHLRHAAQWVVRLADGTEESRGRIERALEDLWVYTGECFLDDATEVAMHRAFGTPLPSGLRQTWSEAVSRTFKEATLEVPKEEWQHSGGREGLHTEHLGHLLAEMQSLTRAHPGASW